MTFARCAAAALLSTASTISHAACYAPLKAALPTSGIVLFGELHGTNEIADFFLGCVKELVAHKEQVDVFIEVDASQNARLSNFANDADALFRLRPGQTQDGRASLAMLSLVRSLQTLPGHPIVARGFDQPGNERDLAMMHNLVAQRDASHYTLVLTGNVHASLARGAPWNADYVPLGNYLVDAGEHVLSLNAHYTGGTAWNCMPGCGVNPMGTPPRRSGEAGHGVVLDAYDPAYSGYFAVGAITASLPAHPQ